MSTEACKGGFTRPLRIGGTDYEECIACSTHVPWDLVDDPFFGFAAGCERRRAQDADDEET